MQQDIDNQPLADLFWGFIQPHLDVAKATRSCRGISDQQWLHMGVLRSLSESTSGRDFLQKWAMDPDSKQVSVSHFFETLKSERRCALVQEINQRLTGSMPTHPEAQKDFATLNDLDRVEVYAGDGHSHAHSTHAREIFGKKRAVSHLYSLNLRTRGMTHLTVADLKDGRKRAEHDMGALKRLNIDTLRQGAAKGRQVLYVWDPAGLDLQQWETWKNHGIYFLSRSKKNLKIENYGENTWDRDDPINHGVLNDSLVSTATSGRTLRLIRYRNPVTGEIYTYLTNHRKIRPGVLCWLYQRRWDIEKSYDTFKNKLLEQKAWATSPTAQTMQALFLCLTHNLMVLLESETSNRYGITDEKENRRRRERFRESLSRSKAHGYPMGKLLLCNPHRWSQLSLKFIRWLRIQLHRNAPLGQALAALRHCYAIF